MKTKEHPRPGDVQHGLHRVAAAAKPAGRQTSQAATPIKMKSVVQTGPKIQSGGFHEGFFDRSIPALDFWRGGDGPVSPRTEADGDEDDEAYPVGAVRPVSSCLSLVPNYFVGSALLIANISPSGAKPSRSSDASGPSDSFTNGKRNSVISTARPFGSTPIKRHCPR